MVSRPWPGSDRVKLLENVTKISYERTRPLQTLPSCTRLTKGGVFLMTEHERGSRSIVHGVQCGTIEGYYDYEEGQADSGSPRHQGSQQIQPRLKLKLFKAPYDWY